MIVWMLLSCNANRLDTGFWTLGVSEPTYIDVFEIECENEQWKIKSNGTLDWEWSTVDTNDNRYERHTVYSVSADPEGENDRLRMSITPSYQTGETHSLVGAVDFIVRK